MARTDNTKVYTEHMNNKKFFTNTWHSPRVEKTTHDSARPCPKSGMGLAGVEHTQSRKCCAQTSHEDLHNGEMGPGNPGA